LECHVHHVMSLHSNLVLKKNRILYIVYEVKRKLEKDIKKWLTMVCIYVL
jgi:hypothetical protein